MKVRDVLYIAFREARILKRPGALDATAELNDGLIFLNQQLDYWSARSCYAYTTTFAAFLFTEGHQPYQIGPGLSPPDFSTGSANRPVDIQSASVILTSPSPVDVPIRLRNRDWWARQSVKSLQSTMPTDLYYEPDYPAGALYFWPIPNVAYGVRLETLVQLRQFTTLDDTFLAPQAYQSALVLTLAEELVDVWGTEMPGNLARRASKARDALQSNNYLAPRIASADWGTSSSSSKPQGDWNYMTGTIP